MRNKIEFKNLKNDKTGSATFKTQEEQDYWSSEMIATGSYGKSERWIVHSEADAWELTREIERRTSNGVVEIHVPNDYEITIIDVTTEHNLEILKAKLTVKKQFAIDSIIHINSLIDAWSTTDKMTMLGRSDVQLLLTFLNYGSIEQSKSLCETLTTDSLLTTEIKSSVVNFLQAKIDQFNAMIWE
jgi:hypothetical protein